MVWSDWGRVARLERADMDGSHRLILAVDNVGWPNGVTIDTWTQRIVWVDAKTEVLLSLCVSLYLSACVWISV